MDRQGGPCAGRFRQMHFQKISGLRFFLQITVTFRRATVINQDNPQITGQSTTSLI